MNSSPEKIKEALVHHRARRGQNQKDFAKFVGISPGTLSEILTDVTAASNDVGLRLNAALEREAEELTGPSSVFESPPPQRVKYEAKPTENHPIGHIPFKGHERDRDRDRDWEMSVPVYADESHNAAVLAAAVRLLNAVRGGTTAPKAEQKGAGAGDTPSVSESLLMSEGDGLTREFHSLSQDNVHGQRHPIIPFDSQS